MKKIKNEIGPIEEYLMPQALNFLDEACKEMNWKKVAFINAGSMILIQLLANNDKIKIFHTSIEAVRWLKDADPNYLACDWQNQDMEKLVDCD